MRDHWGYWMAREAPRPRSTREGGSSAGTEPGRPGVPSMGRGRVRRRPGASRGPRAAVGGRRLRRRRQGTARARAGLHRRSVHLGPARGWLLAGSGRPCGLRNPGPGALGEGGAGRGAFLTWLYLLASALSDSRGPTFQGLQTTPCHPAPDFHLPAQRALFAGLHRYANPGAAKRAAWEAGRGHGGVRRGAARTGA